MNCKAVNHSPKSRAFAFKTWGFYVVLSNYTIGTQMTRIMQIRTDFYQLISEKE